MNTASVGWGIVAVVVIGGIIYFAKPMPKTEVIASPTPTQTTPPLIINTSPAPMSFEPVNSVVHVTFVTSKGNIEVDLDGSKAPLAVGSFVSLAKKNFYTGVTFHRVIPEFMIQAGDPFSKDPSDRGRHGTGGPGYTFKTELPARPFKRGSLGVARTQALDTNGSQFFIVVDDKASFLDGQYTNFGTVTSGMEVADAIVSVKRDANDNPLEPITIKEVIIKE